MKEQAESIVDGFSGVPVFQVLLISFKLFQNSLCGLSVILCMLFVNGVFNQFPCNFTCMLMVYLSNSIAILDI